MLNIDLEKRRKANRDSYQKHKAERQEKARQWRAANPERMKELNKRWYAENHDKALAARKAYREANPEKIRVLMRQWYLENKPKQQAASRMQFTGCPPELYQELLVKQDGLCAICKQPPGKYALAADHCHTTQVIRGLLCFKCNTGLGLLGDTISALQAAIAYLSPR